MTPQSILQDRELESKLAEVLAYSYITGKESVIVKIKTGEFELCPSDRVGYKVSYQGWTECVANDTLVSIIGLGDTSDNGDIEGQKVAAWMRAQ